MEHELLIKNGLLIDGTKIEIAITKGKISAVGSLIEDEAKKTIDLNNASYLSAGWIDGHVHCFEKMNLYYDFPDEIGINKGVTTIIDAGSTGAKNIGDFYQLAQQAKTNVFALVNIANWGITTQAELADLEQINPEAISQVLKEYPDFIVGLKARMSRTVVGANGLLPLKLAKKIQQQHSELPLMVHIGSAPPELVDILAELEKGDIVTHCFNGKENGILAKDESIKSFVLEAYSKGIVFDIGHGTDSFNFHVAERALHEQLMATTISTDIYHRNREAGPVHDLATTLEKLMEVGYSLEELIDKITVQPAKYFKLKNKGQLALGYDGDLTIFKVVKAEKTLMDSNGNQRIIDQQIVPEQVIVGGKSYVIN